MIKTQTITYHDGQTALEGYYAYDTRTSGKRPAVLVIHDWSGRNEFANKKAEKLAELGYVGFAIDMYGVGKQGKTKEEKSALMTPLTNDRAALRERVLAGFHAAKTIPEVDIARIGAMGFCFGGLCALDLARSGAEVRGVVSVHGLLHAPSHVADKKLQAKVLVIQGYDDPMVPPEQVLAFEKEMAAHKADWQVHIYGGIIHGFTNPLANDLELGILYNATADHRSWVAVQNFFAEVLK